MSVRISRVLVATVAFALCVIGGTGCNEDAVPADKNDQVGTTSTTTTTTTTEVPVAGTETVQPQTGVTTQGTEQVAQPVTQPVTQPVVTKTEPVSTQQATVKTKKAPVVQAQAAPKTTQTVTVPAGTTVPASLQSVVTTETNKVGDVVTLVSTKAVQVDGVNVVPVGSKVHGTVTHLKAAGRVKGASELTIRFTEIEVTGGKRYPVVAEAFRVVQKGDGKESAAEIGGASAVGGVLGGVIGGKDDVWKGAAIGAAVGTGVAVATKGDQITLPAGQVIEVRLTAPVVVTDVTL